MKVAVLGGFGAMAEAALHDLAADPLVTAIQAVDLRTDRAKALLSKIPNRRKIKAVKGDFTRMKISADAIINCAWYEHNLRAMECALKAQAHYVDLGGLYHMTLKQLKLDAAFRRINRLAVLGCGSTPGITNMMAARMGHLFERVDSVTIYDASHDPSTAESEFAPPFAIRTMLAEFVQPAPVLKGGRMVEIKAHGGAEEQGFKAPIGRVPVGTVIHSETATLPAYFKDKGIRDCAFKIFYPPAVKTQLAVLAGIGLDQEFISLLTKRAKPLTGRPNDFEVLRVIMKGDRVSCWDCEIRPTKTLTAGAVGVGFTASIAAMLICDGKTKQRSGVAAPESALDEISFFAELKRRPFTLTATTTEPL